MAIASREAPRASSNAAHRMRRDCLRDGRIPVALGFAKRVGLARQRLLELVEIVRMPLNNWTRPLTSSARPKPPSTPAGASGAARDRARESRRARRR
jgi:hypothetical protein